MNRNRIHLILPLCFALVAGCSQRQTAPVVGDGGNSDIEVAGVYQYETILNRGGEPGSPTSMLPERVSGTIRLEGGEGRYTGEVTATGRSAMPITSVMVDQNEVTLQVRDRDGGPITLRLVFQGESFNGQWISSGGMASVVRGTRRQ